MLLLWLTAAGVSAAPALAARGHEFGGAFGWGVLSGASELQRCTATPVPGSEPISNCQPGSEGNGPGQFHNPSAIAVNEATGNVYVLDEANNRVEIFNAAGTKFEGEFNGSGLLPNEGIEAGSGKGPEEVATGEFDEPNGIAIDNSCVQLHLGEPQCKEKDPSNGDVYVADAGSRAETPTSHPVVDKFDASGKYIGQITRNANGELTEVEGKKEDFSELGFRVLSGVAVDPNGEVWVEAQNFGTAFRANAAHYSNAVANARIGSCLTETGASKSPAPGFAVDSEENLYVHNTFGHGDRLAKYDKNCNLLTAEVDEEAPTGVAVEAGSDDVYIAHAQSINRVNSAGTSLERLKEPIGTGTPSFSGVAIDASTLTAYASDPAANRVEPFTPEAPGPPTVQEGSEEVFDVAATSASFSAEVNPRSEPNEEATSYHFEYGPCDTPSTCSSSPYLLSTPSPEGILAPNYEPDKLGAHPQGLQPHTTYHMRVVAHNSHGEGKPGEEVIFTTQTLGPPSSPDNRRYELVSPPDKHGAIILAIGGGGSGVIQASVSGDAISYLTNAPTEPQPAGFSQTAQILSRRGSSSWASQGIATPHEAPVGVSLGSNGEYRFFAEDLSSAVVSPFGPFTKAISAQASERTLYLRSDFPPGDPSKPCGSDCYRPLVSGCPGEGEPCPAAIEEVANVPEGTKFGEEGTCDENCGPFFQGASPDASHVVFSARAALSEGAPEGESGEKQSLYEWSAGKLALVSVLPGGQAASPATIPALGFQAASFSIRIARHALSTDGQRVIFSAGELNAKGEATANRHLYLRRMSGEAQSIQLDTPEAACTAKGKCKGSASPIFQTASADDSRIFFTDTQPLTQSSGSSDLYECEIEEEGEEEPPRCKLSDLTPPGAGEEGAGVLGLAAGASEDGSAIYFTANGKLSGEANARGEEAVAGDCQGATGKGTPESETAPERCNLYLRSAGQTRLVAVLSGADFPDWSLRGSVGLNGLSDRVSPHGRYLAFMSRLSLSGYDNRDALSGKADEEVFLYDSQANGGRGGLACASCDPSGGRPHGVRYSQINAGRTGLAGGYEIWPEGAWIAASIPGWTALAEGQGTALHQSRYLSDQGRLFFNSADALAPKDINNTEDVYEHEPPGAGDCSSEKTTYDPASGGCVALISAGTAKEESAFLDASESGDDVFFLTGQRLLPNEDVDQSLDVYDAHACSSASPCLPEPATPPPACEGDACQSPGAPPEDQTPGSLTFNGPGNPAPPAPTKAKPKSAAEVKAEKLKKALKSCRKQKQKRKRAACEAKARKQHSPTRKAKKSTRRSMV